MSLKYFSRDRGREKKVRLTTRQVFFNTPRMFRFGEGRRDDILLIKCAVINVTGKKSGSRREIWNSATRLEMGHFQFLKNGNSDKLGDF